MPNTERLPYRIWYINSELEKEVIKGANHKRMKALARPLVRKGYAVSAERMTDYGWDDDKVLQALIDNLPASSPRKTKGSTEMHNALQSLAACASALATSSLKSLPADGQKMELLECMEEVETVLGLSTKEEDDDTYLDFSGARHEKTEFI